MAPRSGSAIAGCVYAIVSLVGLVLDAAPAAAADPAVQFMAKVGRELTAAARTRSPGVMSTVLQRYADVSYIGLFSLGSYRNQLTPPERNTYYSGMVKFIGRYAATEAPKYTVSQGRMVGSERKRLQRHHGGFQGDAG